MTNISSEGLLFPFEINDLKIFFIKSVNNDDIKFIIKIEVLYTLKKSKFTNSDQTW